MSRILDQTIQEETYPSQPLQTTPEYVWYSALKNILSEQQTSDKTNSDFLFLIRHLTKQLVIRHCQDGYAQFSLEQEFPWNTQDTPQDQHQLPKLETPVFRWKLYLTQVIGHLQQFLKNTITNNQKNILQMLCYIRLSMHSRYLKQ